MPGLYFIGLEFLYAATSAVLPGVGRDAGYIAKHIAKRVRPGVTALSGADEAPIASHS
jgi:putative flavoprotein involved in K+ transport